MKVNTKKAFFGLGPGPAAGITATGKRPRWSAQTDPMTFDFVPDDYAYMNNADSYNYLAGLFDGSDMGPPSAKIFAHIALGGDPDRTILHRDGTPDFLQWNHTAAAGNCFYIWKGDGDHTSYWDDVKKLTKSWELTIELYRLKTTVGHFIEIYFWGNELFTESYGIIFVPSSNQMRLLKRTIGQDYYWNGTAWQIGVTSMAASLPGSWATLSIKFYPGNKMDIVHSGSVGDTNITEDLSATVTGKPGLMMGAALAGSVGEQLWTREIHRDYL